MKTIRVNEYGDTHVLKLEDLPTPEPKADEALIRLKAAGLNFIDIYMRKGIYRIPAPLPYTPGKEGAGIVEAVGKNVSKIQVGERVAYVGPLGSYAQYNVVKAADLIPLPKELSFEEGAAFPLQGLTAHYLLHDYYRIEPGSSVLVHAAAGGMGLLLVQWLKYMGAYVIGTVSTEEKAKEAKAAGADDIILYTQQDFVAETKKLTDGKGVDYIIDGVGKTTFTKDLDAVRSRGWICLYGAASGPAEPLYPNQLQMRSITISGGNLINYVESPEEAFSRANAVLEGLREGWLKLKIDHVFPLAEAGKAQQLLEERKSAGKVILKID